jgi:hypothetical protein
MMKKSFLLSGLLLVVFLFSACNTVKMVTDPAQVSPKIVLSKGACFGDCPVYTLTIYNSGLVKFNGVRYTPMDGKHEKQLDEATYTDLIKTFDQANLWQFEDLYDMDIADLPTTTLSYADKDKLKTIKGKANLPQEMLDLEKRLEELIGSEGWTMTEAPPERAEDKAQIIDDEIIIKGNSQLILVRWLKKYKQYDLRIGKRLGPESDFWMVRFDKNLIDPDEMLRMIQEDPAIEEAEFNKKIQNRE